MDMTKRLQTSLDEVMINNGDKIELNGHINNMREFKFMHRQRIIVHFDSCFLDALYED